MDRIKVFIYFIFFLIANSAFAQVDIDTINFSIDFPESYLKAYVQAEYIIGTDTSEFDIDDLSDYTFTWSGDTAPDIDSLPTARYYFEEEGTYEITLSVFEKSTSTPFIFSSLVPVQSFAQIIVPNVFTPNGDNLNDLFTVFYDGKAVLEMIVFSRTGTQVFRSKAPTIVWDGRNSSGSELSEGVYFYILTSDDPAVLDQNGFLHLYR